jgi:hypothetical protein
MPMLGFIQKFRAEFVEAGTRGVRAGSLGATSLPLVRGGR